jgi:hypothetical protein
MLSGRRASQIQRHACGASNKGLSKKRAAEFALTFAYTNAYTLKPAGIMEFAGFDWDRGNRKKCQKHGLSSAEIESVFDRPVVILPDEKNSKASGFGRLEPQQMAARRSSCLRCARAATAF